MIAPYYQDDHTTIYHADCRDVLPSIGRVDLILADPPYGDDHDTDYTRFTGGAGVPRSRHARIVGDDQAFDPGLLLGMGVETICFGANRYSDRLPCGSWLIWDKRTPGGNKNVMSDAEIAWWSRGRGVYIFQHTWDGFNRSSERGSKLHPTQKPVALMRWCIARSGIPQGATVLDPYMGSGPVLRAARDMGMRAIGIEINERYCEVAATRMSQGVLDFEEAA